MPNTTNSREPHAGGGRTTGSSSGGNQICSQGHQTASASLEGRAGIVLQMAQQALLQTQGLLLKEAPTQGWEGPPPWLQPGGCTGSSGGEGLGSDRPPSAGAATPYPGGHMGN